MRDAAGGGSGDEIPGVHAIVRPGQSRREGGHIQTSQDEEQYHAGGMSLDLFQPGILWKTMMGQRKIPCPIILAETPIN